MEKDMARKASVKVAAISGISALAVTGLIAFAGSNLAMADDLVNPTSSAGANESGHHEHHGKDGDRIGHDFIDGQIIDRTETFVDDNGVVTTHTISTGTVASVDGNTVTYTNAEGESISVTLADTTVVYRDGVEATAADIAVSDLIAVETETVDGVATVEEVNASSTGELNPVHHGRGHHGPDGKDREDRGNRVGSETTYEDADGNIVTEIDYHGEVTAVNETSITLSLADGTSITIDVNDATVIDKSHATATLADIVATDHVKVDVVDGVATEIRAMTADEFANFESGDRGAHHGPDGDGDMGGHHGGGHRGR